MKPLFLIIVLIIVLISFGYFMEQKKHEFEGVKKGTIASYYYDNETQSYKCKIGVYIPNRSQVLTYEGYYKGNDSTILKSFDRGNTTPVHIWDKNVRVNVSYSGSFFDGRKVDIE